jgi:tetratricopeptide (TPR) repeat protein
MMTLRRASTCGLCILLGCGAPQAVEERADPNEPRALPAKQSAQPQRELASRLLEEAHALIAASSAERYRAFDEQLRKVQSADKAGKYLNDEKRKPFHDAAQAAAAQNELWRSLSVLWARLGEFDKATRAAQQIPPLSVELPGTVFAPLLVLAPGRYEGGISEFWSTRDRQVPRESALSFIAERQIERGDFAQARQTLELIDAKGEKTNAQRLLGLSRLCDAYLQRDRPDEAREVARLFPTYSTRLPQLAAWYAQRGRLDEVRQLASDQGKHPDVASSLVRVLAEKGHPGLAMELYHKLLPGRRGDAALFACAEAFIAQRKIARAREVIELIRTPAPPQAEMSVSLPLLDLLLSFAKAHAAVDKSGAAVAFQEAIAYCEAHTRKDEGNLHFMARVVAALAAADDLSRAVDTAKRARHGRKTPTDITGAPVPRPDPAQEALRLAVNVLVGQEDYAPALKLAGRMPATGMRASALRFIAERAKGDLKTAALQELAAYILAYRIDWNSPSIAAIARAQQPATPEEVLERTRVLTVEFHRMGLIKLLEPFQGNEMFDHLAARTDETEEVTKRVILSAYVADLLARKQSQEAVKAADRLLGSLKDPQELSRAFDAVAEAFADHGHLDQARRYGRRKLEVTGREIALGPFWRVKIRAFSEQMQRLEAAQKPGESVWELVGFLEAWMILARDMPLTVEQCDLAVRQAERLACLDRAARPLAQAYAIQGRFERAKELLRGAGDQRRYQDGLGGVIASLISGGHLRQAIALLPEVEGARPRRDLERKLIDAMDPAEATTAVVPFARQQPAEDRARLFLLIADRLVSHAEQGKSQATSPSPRQ